MIIIDSDTRTLELFLAGVPVAELPWITSYADFDDSTDTLAPTTEIGTSNGVTAATILSAPDIPSTRKLEYFSIRNQNAADAVVTIQLNDTSGPTLTIIVVITLSTGDTLEYTDANGWHVFDKFGKLKGPAELFILTGADGQLPNTKQTLYTAVNDNEELLGIQLVSSDGASYACNLYLNRTGTSRRLIALNKPVVDDLSYPPIANIKHSLNAGDLVEGDAASANKVDYIVSIKRYL
jgi:hypothetical protein